VGHSPVAVDGRADAGAGDGWGAVCDCTTAESTATVTSSVVNPVWMRMAGMVVPALW
jgi:hypothetical protein